MNPLTTALTQVLQGSGNRSPNLSLTFTPPLAQQLAGQQLPSPLSLTVTAQVGNQLTLTLPSGQTLQALVPFPVSTGTQLQLTLPTQLPTTSTLPLPARILAAPPTTNSPAVALAQAGQPPTTTYQLTNPQLITYHSSLITSSPIPPGPIAIQLPTNIPTSNIPTFSSVTITTTPNAQGFQSTNTPLAVNVGTPLPLGTTLTIALPTPPSPASLAPSLPASLPTTAQLLTSTLPTTPASPTTALPNPQSPTIPSTLPASLAPFLPASLPTASLPTTARILTTPTPTTPTQTLLLSSGTTITFTLPTGTTPLPAGTTFTLPTGTTPLPAGTTFTLTPSSQPNTPPTLTNLQLPTSFSQSLVSSLQSPVSTYTLTASTPTPTGTTLTLQPTTPNQPPITLTIPTSTQTTSIPLGSTLTLSLPAVALAKEGQPLAATILTITPPSPTPLGTLTTLGQAWPQLTTALATLAQFSPALAQQLTQRLPQLAALVPTLLPYVEQLKSTPQSTLEDTTTQLLRSMGINLAPDLAAMSQLAQQRLPDGWQGFVFPYQESPQSAPQQGRFFWQRQGSSDNDTYTSTNTRFVVEASLSQLGPIQLDGLFQPTGTDAQQPALQLKFRTQAPLTAAEQTDLITLVTTTLTTFGLAGGISLEAAPSFPFTLTQLIGGTENTISTTA